MGLNERDVYRMGPAAKAQIMRKLAAPKKESKYHNRETKTRERTGEVLTFDSRHEADRWRELQILERTGEILDLRRQVSFELLPVQHREDGKPERGVVYVADFVYVDAATGKTVVEDAKGVRTREYVIKRKLLLWRYGLSIREV